MMICHFDVHGFQPRDLINGQGMAKKLGTWSIELPTFLGKRGN